MYFNKKGNFSTLNRGCWKVVEKFTYLGSINSSTESDINTHLSKAWQAIDHMAVLQRLCQYYCTDAQRGRWPKGWEKGLDGNCTRIMNKFLKNTPRNNSCAAIHFIYLKPSNKKNKIYRTLMEKQRRYHKWYSPIDHYTWRCQCKLTNKNLPKTDLYGDRR